jgi:23S rRNA pseudouridine2605 synthase
MAEERLQKILAHAGITSRRRGEQYILDGRVVVNGVMVTTLGTKADLDKDFIKVDGKLLRKPKRLVYVALNKPNNCVTTLEDPEGRPTVMQHIRGIRERIYPVGRLDYHSEGLLLFTNDGEFAHRLTSAAYHVPKTYLVKVNGHLSMAQELEFREGIPMHGRRTAPAGLKLIKHGINPWYEVRLIEGRQNQIRVMFKHFGRLVEKLKRVKIGFLELGPLKLGEVRHLSVAEVARFRKFLKMD